MRAKCQRHASNKWTGFDGRTPRPLIKRGLFLRFKRETFMVAFKLNRRYGSKSAMQIARAFLRGGELHYCANQSELLQTTARRSQSVNSRTCFPSARGVR